MTMHSGDVTGSGRRDDRVEVAEGVPTDRVRWGPILAGTFAALTALAVLNTLGAAIGLSAYDPGENNPRNFAIAAGVWGLVSMLISFAFGAWLTARSSAVRGGGNGLLNGFMVAAFGIPLMFFIVGSAGAAAAQSPMMSGGRSASASSGGQSDPGAQLASATISSDSSNASMSGGANASANDNNDVKRKAAGTAWGTFAALALGIAAACAAGYVGGQDGHHHRNGDRHHGTHTLGT